MPQDDIVLVGSVYGVLTQDVDEFGSPTYLDIECLAKTGVPW
jgi:hypothetical protein